MRQVWLFAALTMILALPGAGTGGVAWADGLKISADAFRVARGDRIEAVRQFGKWLCYHEGRKGRFVFDLDARKQHDLIRQFQRIPYGVNNSIVLDYDAGQDSGWLYYLKRKQRKGWPSRRFGELKHIWMGSTWFAYDREVTRRETMERTNVLYWCNFNKRWATQRVTHRYDQHSVSVGGAIIAWYNPWLDEEGIYIYDTAAADPVAKRIVNVDGLIRPDTDGKSVVWYTDQSAYRYDLKTGKTADVLEDQLSRACTSIQVDGDWIVWTDDDWNLHARHLPSGKIVQVANSDTAGINTLLEVSGGYVVWQCADELWAAKLTVKK